MALKEVEIYIEDFNDDEILNEAAEIYNRLSKTGYKPKMEMLDNFLKKLKQPSRKCEKISSKVDQWKDELWPLIKEKYSLEQLEALL